MSEPPLPPWRSMTGTERAILIVGAVLLVLAFLWTVYPA